MKSEIQGPMEKIVLPVVEKIRAPALIGADVRFDPAAAKAIADTIERLAQELDNSAAAEWRNKCFNVMLYGIITITSGLALLAKFY
jgi:hypothetical protein